MLKKLSNNNIGATSYIERTLMYLVIFVITTFALDLILLASTMIIANHQLNYISNKLQYQSGFIGSSSGDGETGHWSNKDFCEYLEAGMASVGIDGKTYTWELKYDNDIFTNGINYQTMFASNGAKNFSYKTPGNKATLDNLGQAQANNSNVYQTSALKLSFDYHYRFSGKVFYMLHVLTKMSLYSEFNNRYVNS